MTFSLRRKLRITRRATSTSNRTACSLAATLLLGGFAFADPDGQPRSTFTPRDDVPRAGLAAPVLPVQAKSDVPPAKKDVAAPAPGGVAAKTTQDPYEAYIRLEPPGRERLFSTLDTERQLEERMRQERRDSGPPSNDQIAFPPRPEITADSFQARKFEPTVCQVEPAYVVYRRLYFEEKNAERYGWEIGPLQTAVSTLYFFKDVALLPHNIATYPCRRFETDAGQCQPGDPVPYRLYPLELTGSGLLAEVGTIALIAAIIPP
jgi:hypothetical protein